MPGQHGITLVRFRILEDVLLNEGYGHMIEWSETIAPPRKCRVFAREVIYVIVNSGMRVTVARMIYWRCVHALNRRQSVTTVFGHPGKAAAIDFIWANRRALFQQFKRAPNKLTFCQSLPWIGPVTRHHLAKNLGVNTVKPDVHLARLARVERVTAWDLCARLAAQTGYREATIDTILWKACADKVLDSAEYVVVGWDAALRPGAVRLVKLLRAVRREREIEERQRRQEITEQEERNRGE